MYKEENKQVMNFNGREFVGIIKQTNRKIMNIVFRMLCKERNKLKG